jgi:hypothetical protein
MSQIDEKKGKTMRRKKTLEIFYPKMMLEQKDEDRCNYMLMEDVQ